MPRDRRGELGEGRLSADGAGGDRVERALEGVEPGQPLLGRRVAFVGDVVGGARKAIDRDDRRPEAPWARSNDATGKFS